MFLSREICLKFLAGPSLHIGQIFYVQIFGLFEVLEFKFLVRLHGEYNILVKLCGNTT